MKIGYGKIGRSMPLTLSKCGNLGGDVEMVAVVKELALRHPEDDFYLVGRNSGELPSGVGLPSNVHNPWVEWRPRLRSAMDLAGIKGNMSIDEHLKLNEIMMEITGESFHKLDGIVMWVGQHGSSNMPIPMTADRSRLTKPHDSYAFYASFLLQGINRWRDQDPLSREEIYLNADARNRHKMRDLKWPLRHPILTQYNFTNAMKHERYGEVAYPSQLCDGKGWNWGNIAQPVNYPRGDLWQSEVRNVYSRLEINGLAPGTPFGDLITWSPEFDRPYNFGMFINEARAIGVPRGMDRLSIMQEWVMPLPLRVDWLHGTWSDNAKTALKMDIKPAPWDQYYPLLNATRCTFTTPSSGSHWATAKPWEAFAGGTVCFFHPDYDKQDNILGDANSELRDWLRVKTPQELRDRVAAVCASPVTFNWLITEQRKHFDDAMREKRYLRMIEKRLYE